MGKTNTIAAIATPLAPSGIGIIRISGEDALAVADRIFTPAKTKQSVFKMQTHTIHYGYICDGETVIDEVLLLVMRGPHTYTCEDTIEIDTHGGILVMRRILDLVLRSGARLAEPGEYTKRAFLNGRMDLTQAEAVIDVINAKNENALRCSVSQLRGSIHEKITDLRARLLHEIAFIEAALDDPEHYSLDGYEKTLETVLNGVDAELAHLLKKAEDGRIVRDGIRTVIAGKPNAGKSSFLNYLLGEERAIVTDIAGTTRDILTEQIQVDGIGLQIVDTAGIRPTDDPIEQIGVARTREEIRNADLVLYIVDASTKLDENDYEILESIRDKKAIVLLNKSDLPMQTDVDTLRVLTGAQILVTSMTQETGLDDFADLLKQMFFDGELAFHDEVYITNARQKEALQSAKDDIAYVLDGIRTGVPIDLLPVDLMGAYEALGSIIGEALGDDLADKIFAEFCMGK